MSSATSSTTFDTEMKVPLPSTTVDCSICWSSILSTCISSCAYCDIKCCSKCLETYILSVKQEPHCFSCKKPYTDMFIEKHTSRSFRSEKLQNHYKDIIWDREQALMVSSQGAAAARLNEKRVMLYDKWERQATELDVMMEKQFVEAIKLRKQLIDVAKKMKELPSTDGGYKVLQATAYNILKMIHFMSHFEVQSRFNRIEDLRVLDQIQVSSLNIDQIQAEIDQLMIKKAELVSFVIDEDILQLRRACFGEQASSSASTRSHSSHSQTVREAKFTKQCPSLDCRGFCDLKGVCGICSRAICLSCWVEIPKTVEPLQAPNAHVCKPEDIASKQAIVQDSKPCPKCKVPIHRIEGCDHMFCVNCKTGFNWRTGNVIDNSQNTNPLLAEWLRGNRSNDANNDENDTGSNECRGNIQQQVLRMVEKACHIKTPLFINASEYKPTLAEGGVYIHYDTFYRLFRQLANLLNIFRVRADQHNIVDLDQINHELRVKYIIKEIDEKSFKRDSLQATKKSKTTIEIHQLHDMFFAALHELMNTLLNKHQQLLNEHNLLQVLFMQKSELEIKQYKFKGEFGKFFKDWEKKLIELRTYYNSCLDGIFNRYYLTTDRKLHRENFITNEWNIEGHGRA